MTCLDDATVLGLVEGRLAPEQIAHVDEHIDSCASCREVVTLVAGSRSSSRVLARGDNVGRYVIGDLLGAGAMGRVYSAWEPELDRRVAIKVLHDAGSRDRLVKEAQAMARLNHPNIVTVHEVGSTDAPEARNGSVFVAMELVDGETLRAWADKPRRWRDVVRMLVEVARGLAAVHAAGVVHRDVKPDNVIVGADGRVRLGDFGLARSGASAGAAPAPSSFALGTLSGGSAVAGTPAYMAPEVLRGGAADAASDQFSFGVLAYELLAGKRPFAGATWADLLRAIEDREVRAIRDVPSWLDDLVQRCIEVDPGARHASMAIIADKLGERLSRRSPLVWLATALGATVFASVVTWAVVPKHDEPRGQLAIAPAWNTSEQARLAARGVSTAALSTIERWNTAWIEERDHAARTARHDNLDRVAARERCLVQRRDELAALLDASSRSPDRLLDAVAALPPPSECRKADSDPLPSDPASRAIAVEVTGKLPALRAQIALGTGSPVAAQQLVERAQQSGHAPTLADALLVKTEALRAADRHAEAAIAARDAAAAAERGHADLLRARAWLARVAIAGEQRNLDTAEDLGAIAQATIDRVGAPHLAVSLARLRGLIAYNRGRLPEARTFLLDARQRFVVLGRTQPLEGTGIASVDPAPAAERTLEIAAVDSALGSVARAAGDLDEAERRHRSVLALDRELRGPNHRDVARDLHNIAGVLRLRGDLERALATYREALAVEIATQGERSIAAGLTHNSIGLVELERDDFAAAKTDFELARDILTGSNHGDRAFAEHNLGLVAQAQGDHKAALAHFDAAAEIYNTTIGSDAPAAVRLVADRARSESPKRTEPGKRQLVKTDARTAAKTDATKADAAKPKPGPAQPAAKRDVGVYGSAQSW